MKEGKSLGDVVNLSDELGLIKKFGKNSLEGLFQAIGSRIPKPIKAYLLGGGAMVFRNQKPATKDVDILLDDASESSALGRALRELGYAQSERLESEYSEMYAAGGIWKHEGDARVDLFVKKVCNCLELTPNMKKRSEPLGNYDNLSVSLFSNEDVVLFKSITDRVNDTDDVATIILTAKIDWQTVLAECKAQSGNRAWYGSVLSKFDELKDRGLDIPLAAELQPLYEKRLLADAYGRRKDKRGHESAVKELKEEGFTEKELRDAELL